MRERAAAGDGGRRGGSRRRRPEPAWAQRGGTVNDASCLSRTAVAGVVAVRARGGRGGGSGLCARARPHRLGGRGQALDGRPGVRARRRHARHAPAERDRARSRRGARSRSAPARPGTTSRTPSIRASRSRRCNRPTSSPSAARSRSTRTAWTIAPGALMGSIRSLRIMLADGRVVTASRDDEPELFALAVGGYGLFGVILSAELDVVPNDIYASQRAGDRTIANFRRPSRGSRRTRRSGSPTPIFRPRRARCSKRPWSIPTGGSTMPGIERPPLGEVGGDALAAAVRQPRQARRLVALAQMVGGEKSRAPVRDLHGDAGAGDGRRRGLPRHPQRSDARQRRLSAQQPSRRDRHPPRIFRAARRGSCRSSTACGRSSARRTSIWSTPRSGRSTRSTMP